MSNALLAKHVLIYWESAPSVWTRLCGFTESLDATTEKQKDQYETRSGTCENPDAASETREVLQRVDDKLVGSCHVPYTAKSILQRLHDWHYSNETIRIKCEFRQPNAKDQLGVIYMEWQGDAQITTGTETQDPSGPIVIQSEINFPTGIDVTYSNNAVAA